MTSGGIRTKVVAVGIEGQVSRTELSNIASAPADRNVILVHSSTRPTDVQQRLINAIGLGCIGQ